MSTITTRAGKGSPLTNNEVDANFTNLNNDKLESADLSGYAELTGATFTGDVEGTEFIGSLRGNNIFKAQAGEALSKGDAVYISGISGNTPVVSLADSDSAGKMPAFGMASDAASANSAVDIVTYGQLTSVDTSAFSLGDTLYVSNTPGQLTSTAPSGESSLIQNLGKVERVHATAGILFVAGAGRTNATPNLNDGQFFLGNGSNQAVSADFTTSVLGEISAGTGIGISASGVISNTDPDQTVSLTGGTGISTSGTYPNFTITNDSPDQTVSLTGAGTTTVSGTYPNFTITGAGTTYTAGSGLSLTGTEFANTAPDQTVVLTGAGATSISGTYPNFTISSTDSNTTYAAGTGITLNGTTFSLTDTNAKLNLSGGTLTGTLVVNSTNDAQITLTSADSWTGIGFNDGAALGAEYIWHNGNNGTFAIGGGGSNVSGKKLHVDGGTTIGSTYDNVTPPTDGLNVQGDIYTNANLWLINYGADTHLGLYSVNNAKQRADSRNESTFARTHWYGVSDTGGTSNFRHAWYDGNSYVNVTAENDGVTFTGTLNPTQGYKVNGTTVIDSSRNITATRFRSANGTIAPLSSSYTFSNVFTSEDSATRVAYFDGNGGNASVWWGNGSNAHAALDSSDGLLDVWVNPSNGSWYNIADFSTSGLNVTTGTARVGGNTVWHTGNDGSGSGLDADLLDGQHGSHYTNAGNLNAGTLPDARLATSTTYNLGGIKVSAVANDQNYIAFSGTTGDQNGNYNHTYIGERVYSGTEKSELVLAKYNDVEGTSGSDRIRHIANNHVFDTYTGATSAGANASLSTAVGTGTLYTRMTIRQNGDIEVGGSKFVDSSRNLTNIGTIGSGAITSTSSMNAAGGYYVSGTEVVNASRHLTNIVSISQSNTLSFTTKQGTWITANVFNDAIGWNATYGVYIGSNVGGTHYLRGNGTFTTGGNTYNLWHTGNDGSGSGLDADTVDGIHASSFLRSDALTYSSSNIGRANHHLGHLVGSYNNIGGNSGVPNPIYSIGTNYLPTATGLSNFYGVGFAHPNLWGSGKTAGWGLYTTDAGNVTFTAGYSGGTNGIGVWSQGKFVSTPQGTLWGSSNDGSGSGLDADTVDGYNTSTSATANTVVVREGSGHIYGNYILGSYFNASSGNNENPTIGQVWTQSTGDNYLRKSTPAHFKSQLGLWHTGNDGSGSGLDADTLRGISGDNFLRKDIEQTVSANILFANSTTAKRGISGTMSDNDQWFVGGAGTGSNAGYLEISTGDDGQTSGSAEYIYVRQYGPGSPLTGTLTRTAALLDNYGNTYFPGNVTAYYSDERLKTKTGNITNAIEKVQSLSGFYYVENELAKQHGYSTETQQVGLSAQEVKAVLPEAVSLAPFDRIADEVTNDSVSKSGEEYLTVDYSRLVPLLIESIKELKSEVDDLKTQLETK